MDISTSVLILFGLIKIFQPQTFWHDRKLFKKSIFIISTTFFIVITGKNGHAQQNVNSQIIIAVNKELKSGNLYYEPMDSVIERFKYEIIVHKKNVTFSNSTRIYDARPPQTKFEDLIKVVPTNLNVVNNGFKVDTIFYYFNNKKLIKCWCVFTLPINGYRVQEKAIDSIYKILNKEFNLESNGTEINVMDYAGYAWYDDYTAVNFLISSPSFNNGLKADPTKAYLSIDMFMPPKGNVLLEIQTYQIKTDRKGKGNSTFYLTVSELEPLINSNTTLKMLEDQLGQWDSYGNINQVVDEYDDKTKSFTTPLFEVYYDSVIRNKYYAFNAEISNNLKNPIKEFKITASLNGLQLAEFKESLRTRKYLLNEDLTDILKKQAYEKRIGHNIITIRYNDNGTYTIGISK